MVTLIELHDLKETVNNLLGVSAFHPQRLILFGGSLLRHEAFRRPVLEASGVEDVQFITCSMDDINDICETLREVLRENGPENCVVDITGGPELMIFAAGRLFSGCSADVVQYRPGRGFLHVFGPRAGQVQAVQASFTLEQTLKMAGGQVLRSGRNTDEAQIKALFGVIPALFAFIRRDPAAWEQFTRYFQQTAKTRYLDGDTYRAPLTVQLGRRSVRCPKDTLLRLSNMGIFTLLGFDEEHCSFRLAQSALRRYLGDAGVWLELYLYRAMTGSGLFEETATSTVVCWDDDRDPSNNVENEVDVIGLCGMGQLFISCKLSPDTAALNEIAAITARFGSRYAIPVLACIEDVRVTMPALAMRAYEMGIELLCGSDLDENSLQSRLTALSRRAKLQGPA